MHNAVRESALQNKYFQKIENFEYGFRSSAFTSIPNNNNPTNQRRKRNRINGHDYKQLGVRPISMLTEEPQSVSC
jgi:hypothetical protein